MLHYVCWGPYMPKILIQRFASAMEKIVLYSTAIAAQTTCCDDILFFHAIGAINAIARYSVAILI